jgi:hypothetical protein
LLRREEETARDKGSGGQNSMFALVVLFGDQAMMSDNVPNSLSDEFRRRAVARVAEHIRSAVARCGSDTRRLLQEMERYNIELEMKIEEMRHCRIGQSLAVAEIRASSSHP